MATKKTTKKVSDTATPKAGKSDTGAKIEKVELPAGTGTQNTEPPPSNPAPIERGATPDGANPGIIKTDGAEDTIRRQKDKARWAYGEGASSTEAHADRRAIDQQIAEDTDKG
jgi:hypothetical protein